MNKTHQRGATIAELLILTVIITIISLIVLGTCARAVKSDDGQAETAARAFGRTLGLDVRGASCVDYDSDGDGYVSCTLSVREGETTRVLAVECARAVTWATGCRMQKPGMVGVPR